MMGREFFPSDFTDEMKQVARDSMVRTRVQLGAMIRRFSEAQEAPLMELSETARAGLKNLGQGIFYLNASLGITVEDEVEETGVDIGTLLCFRAGLEGSETVTVGSLSRLLHLSGRRLLQIGEPNYPGATQLSHKLQGISSQLPQELVNTSLGSIFESGSQPQLEELIDILKPSEKDTP